VTAYLNLPICIPTNYDEFMESALTSRRRTPDSELSKGNELLKKETIFRFIFGSLMQLLTRWEKFKNVK